MAKATKSAKKPSKKAAAKNGGSTDAVDTGSAAQAADGPPSMKILGQYLKDLSFENPNAPQSLGGQAQPEINISVNVNARPLAETDFEVELHLEAKAMQQETTVFAADLLYCYDSASYSDNSNQSVVIYVRVGIAWGAADNRRLCASSDLFPR